MRKIWLLAVFALVSGARALPAQVVDTSFAGFQRQMVKQYGATQLVVNHIGEEVQLELTFTDKRFLGLMASGDTARKMVKEMVGKLPPKVRADRIVIKLVTANNAIKDGTHQETRILTFVVADVRAGK